MAPDDGVPRLRIREVALVLLVVAAVVGFVAIKAARSRTDHLTGPLAQRLAQSHGAYDVRFPPHTTLAQARAVVFKPFPRDARTVFNVEKPYCVAEVITSRRLERRHETGIVGVEFISNSKDRNSFAPLDKRNVGRALVASLAAIQQPSC